MYKRPLTRFSIGIIFLATISIMLAWGMARNQSLAQAAPLLKNDIDGDTLSVGDIVTTGVLGKEGECKFEPFQIHKTASEDNETEWMGAKVNPNCQMVVTARWRGDLESGPSDVVKPLLEILPLASEPVLENVGSPFENHLSASTTSLQSTGCKTSYQNIYMYGYGGPADKLTIKWGELKYCYNGTTVWIDSQRGGCKGSTLPTWRWVVDRCRTTGVNYGPTTSFVYRSGDGNYHCDPPGAFPCNLSNPDGYYHTLSDGESGYPDGRSYCSYGYGGNIVLGVGQQIVQGCR